MTAGALGRRAVAVVGTGSGLPSTVLTNEDLAKRVQTDDEWIRSRTGIRERRVVAPGETTTTLSERAARAALEAAELAAGDVSLIVVGTTSPDHPMYPCTAALLQKRLGAEQAYGFDVSLACTGFVAAFSVAESLVSLGRARNAVVIGADVNSAYLDWSDRNTCVIFGDGAGACVIRPAAPGEASEVLYAGMGLDGNDEFLVVPGGGAKAPATHETVEQRLHYIRMKGRETARFATTRMVEEVRRACAAAAVPVESLDLVVPHQVNLRILESAAERLGLPFERFVINIERYGNTSGGSVPIALDEAVRAGRLRRGGLVCLVAFGAGLSWGSILLRY